MDVNQLLDTSTPFTQEKVQLLDQVVNALYGGAQMEVGSTVIN